MNFIGKVWLSVALLALILWVVQWNVDEIGWRQAIKKQQAAQAAYEKCRQDYTQQTADGLHARVWGCFEVSTASVGIGVSDRWCRFAMYGAYGSQDMTCWTGWHRR